MAKFKQEDGTEVEAFTADEVKAQIDKETHGLKSKLDELLGETKSAKQKAKELEEAQAREAEERAKEKGEFKSLYESERKTKQDLADKYSALENKIRQGEIHEVATKVAAELTRDAKRMELIVKEVSQFAKHGEKGITFEIGGVEVDQAKIVLHITQNYPFLIDGSGATGGGATGGKNTGRASAGKSDGTRAERIAHIANKYQLKQG